MPSRLRIATVNVNGVRAAYRHGMGAWLDARDVDILALQEVRASTEDLEGLLGSEWNILHDAATAKGRAGVALASRGKADIHRVDLGDEKRRRPQEDDREIQVPRRDDQAPPRNR
jgi:exodeoxyribonuclease-3